MRGGLEKEVEEAAVGLSSKLQKTGSGFSARDRADPMHVLERMLWLSC